MCKCNVLILICVCDISSWCIDVKCVNMCFVIVNHGVRRVRACYFSIYVLSIHIIFMIISHAWAGASIL